MAKKDASPLELSGLRLYVADRVKPFFERVLEERDDTLALHVIGSAVTDDFEPDRSDINTMIVLKEMDLDVLDFLGRLCQEFADSRMRSPLLMTPKDIERWQRLSPIELLAVKLINVPVFGVDLLSEAQISREAVREQCKWDLRRRLIDLSWGYVRAAGRKRELTELLHESVTGLAPLVRGLLYSRGEEPPRTAMPLFDALASLVGTPALSFKEVYWMKLRETRMPVARVRATLKDYYRAMEALIDVVDRMEPAEES